MNPAAPWLALAAGLVLVSTAGPFILLSRIDPFALVLERMGLAAPLFFAWGAAAGGLSIPKGEGRRVALGGVLLAAHFLLWIKAFDLTSYASNLLLLIAQPVVAALLGARIGEKPVKETWIGLGIALVGLAVIVKGDIELGPRALLGDLLSVLGGVAISLFYMVTRRARAAMPLPSFMGWTLVAGAATALPVVLVAGSPLEPGPPAPGAATAVLGWEPTPWVWLGGLVLVTTMGGHGLMNLAARRLRLFTVNVVIVLEPAIAIGFGILFLDETVTAQQVLGGAILALSVVVALLPDWRSARRAPAPPAIVPE